MMGEKKVGKIQNQSSKSKKHFGKDFGLTVAPSDWSSTIQLSIHSIFHSKVWQLKNTPKPSALQLKGKIEQQFSHFWHLLPIKSDGVLYSPLSDIFFLDPHDITRYFAIWYDYHTILTIFYDSLSVQNLSKKSAEMRDMHE